MSSRVFRTGLEGLKHSFFLLCFKVLREGSISNLNFVQNKRLEEWSKGRKRRKFLAQWRLEGKHVTEELVGLGLAVERGLDWCYDDSDDEKTPEDGGSEGYGVVVGWRTQSGSLAEKLLKETNNENDGG